MDIEHKEKVIKHELQDIPPGSVIKVGKKYYLVGYPDCNSVVVYNLENALKETFYRYMHVQYYPNAKLVIE